MNLNNNPTREQLRELVAGCDDRSGHHALWVSRSGDVRITPLKHPQLVAFEQSPPPDAQMLYEVFRGGFGYVGVEAAADESWLDELYSSLVRHWPEVSGTPLVARMDLMSVIEGK